MTRVKTDYVVFTFYFWFSSVFYIFVHSMIAKLVISVTRDVFRAPWNRREVSLVKVFYTYKNGIYWVIRDDNASRLLQSSILVLSLTSSKLIFFKAFSSSKLNSLSSRSNICELFWRTLAISCSKGVRGLSAKKNIISDKSLSWQDRNQVKPFEVNDRDPSRCAFCHAPRFFFEYESTRFDVLPFTGRYIIIYRVRSTTTSD